MTTQRNSIGLSGPAAAKLATIREALELDEGFFHRVTNSVVIEFLAWFYETRGQEPIARFSPATKAQGRPSVLFRRDQRPSSVSVRPSQVRKLAGLDRDGNPTKLSE